MTSCLTAALAFVTVAHAQTNNWQWQVGSNDWGTAGNWQLDPTGNSGLYAFVIGSDGVNSPPYTSTQISSGSYAGTSLQSVLGLNMIGGSLTLSSTTATSTISSTLAMSGGTLSNAGTLNVTGLNLMGGTLTGAGTVNVASSFTMSAASGSTLNVSTNLNIAGTGTWNTNSTVSNAGGSFNILNGASLTLSGAGILNNGSFSNAGTLTYNSATAPQGYYGVEATVAVNSGMVVNQGGFEADFWAATTDTNTGTFTNLSSGANSDGSGNWLTVGSGNETINQGTIQGLVNNSGTWVYSNSGSIDNENTIQTIADNSFLYVIPATEVLNNGLITMQGQNDVEQVYSASGSIVNNGTISLVGSGTLEVYTGGSATNTGTITLQGNGNLFFYGNGSTTNQGTISLVGSGNMYLGVKNSTFDNTGGTILVSGAGATAFLNGNWNNDSSLGTMSAVNGGLFELHPSFVLNNVGETFDGAAFLGGNYLFDGGTISGGSVINASAMQFAPGSSGTLNGVDISGGLNLNNATQGAALVLAGGTTLDAGSNVTVGSNNTLRIDQTSAQETMTGGALVNNGTILLESSLGSYEEGGYGNYLEADTFTNNGTINVTGQNLGVDFSGDVAVANYGTMELNGAGSAITVGSGSNGILNAGTFSLNSTGGLGDFYSRLANVENSGTIAVNGVGNTMLINAAYQNGGGEFINDASGQLIVSGANLVEINSSLGSNSETLNYGLMEMGSINGDYNNESFLDLSTTIYNYGTYESIDTTGSWPWMELGSYTQPSYVENDGTFFISHSNIATNDAGYGTFVNNGTITAVNGGSYFDRSLSITNSAAGVIDIDNGGSSIGLENAAGTFTNNGNLTVVGAYEAYVNDATVNTGTITAYAGAPLTFNNPAFTNSGLVTAVSGGEVEIANDNGNIVNQFSADTSNGIVANAGTVLVDFNDGTVAGDNGSTQNYGVMSSINGGTLDDRSTNFTNESTGGIVVANPWSYMEVGSAVQASTVINDGYIDVSAVGGFAGNSTFFSNRYSNANNPSGFQSTFTNNGSIYVHDDGSWSDNSGLMTNNGTIWTDNSALVYIAGQGGTFVNTGNVGSRESSTIVVNPQGNGNFINNGGAFTAATGGNTYVDSTNIQNLNGGFIMGYGGSQMVLDYPGHWANDITNSNSYIGADWGETDLFSNTIENTGGTLEARNGGYMQIVSNTLTNDGLIDAYWPSYDDSHMTIYAGFLNNDYPGSIIANQNGSITVNSAGSGATTLNDGLTEAENGGTVTDNSANYIQGGTLYATTGGSITVNDGYAANYWAITVDPNSSITFANGYQQLYSLAVTTVNGTLNAYGQGAVLGDGITAGDGGTLTGSGQVNGGITNISGVIAPIGTLTTQNLTLEGGSINGPGTLAVQDKAIFGVNPNETITNTADLLIQGEAEQDSYNMDVQNFGGKVTVAPGATFNFYSVGLSTGQLANAIGTGAGFVGGKFINDGTMNMNESPGVYISNNGNWFETDAFVNNGAINIGGNNLPVDFYGVYYTKNTGTLDASGNNETITMGTYGTSNTLLNSGTMDYTFSNSFGDLYSFAGNIENSGTIQVSGTNSSFYVYAGFNAPGTTFVNDASGQVIVSGPNYFEINPQGGASTETLNYGLLEMEFSNGNYQDAFSDLSSTIVNYGTYEVQDVPGSSSYPYMEIGGGSGSTIDNEGQIILSHASLDTNAYGPGSLLNDGSISLSNGGNWRDYSGTVTNSATGTITATFYNDVQVDNANGTFTNNGTVSLSNGSALQTAGTVVNAGTINVCSGSTMTLSGSSFTNTASGVISIYGPSYGTVNAANLAASTSTNFGTVQLMFSGDTGYQAYTDASTTIYNYGTYATSSTSTGTWPFLELGSYTTPSYVENDGLMFASHSNIVSNNAGFGTFVNNAQINTVNEGVYIDDSSSITNSATGNIDVEGGSLRVSNATGTFTNNGTVEVNNNFNSFVNDAMVNNGSFSVSSGEPMQFNNPMFTNTGLVTATNGAEVDIAVHNGQILNQFNATPGTGIVANGGIVKVDYYDGNYAGDNGSTQNYGVMASVSGGTLIDRSINFTNESTGSLTVTGGSTLNVRSPAAVNAGSILVDSTSTATFDDGYTQLGATAVTRVKGVLNVVGAGLTLGDGATPGDGGLLTGNGVINGSVTNLSGTVQPGDPQILTLNGNYTQGLNGALILDIAGNGPAGAPNGYDQLNVNGNLTLQGTIDLIVSPSFSGGPVDLFNYTGSLTIIGDVMVDDLSNPAGDFMLTPADNGTGGGSINPTIASTPEPATFLPVALGVGALALRRRRKAA